METPQLLMSAFLGQELSPESVDGGNPAPLSHPLQNPCDPRFNIGAIVVPTPRKWDLRHVVQDLRNGTPPHLSLVAQQY